jgi:bifunctional non-homologous end joining protein LigD
MPAAVQPMLATGGVLPVDLDQYAFEYKWDGVRGIAYVEPDGLKLHSRNGLDITFKYPELQPLAAALDGRRAILDGEIVCLHDAGHPSFPHLQQRMQVSSRAAVEKVRKQYPVWFVLFDVLWLDGQWTTHLPLPERRELLEELTVEGPNWQTSPSHIGEGRTMLETARRHGIEGIVAKRLDSTYEPGRRSSAWVKIKIVHRQEFVIGGWVPEESAAARRVGSMLIGYHDCDGKLRYAGRIGTGLNADWHERLFREFAKRSRSSSPFADFVPLAGVQFVHPKLVAEIEFRRWPDGGLVQQGAFKGLRQDKKPADVVKEFNGIA